MSTLGMPLGNAPEEPRTLSSGLPKAKRRCDGAEPGQLCKPASMRALTASGWAEYCVKCGATRPLAEAPSEDPEE